MNIDKLKHLESIQNKGRGVSCVRSIITYLERNDAHTASVVFYNEHDKIHNYPEIEGELVELLKVSCPYKKSI
jgi:hypothetical protein